MNIDKELLMHISKTARLNLTDSEIKEFLPQLKEILDAFEKIKEVETAKIQPSYHPVDIKNSVREDVPKESFSPNQAFRNTSHKQDKYFKGPRVI
jgi:aspartyl-tRNA(Asn)/glutamyl-tRNA(Gln) amidotransferase subunit C